MAVYQAERYRCLALLVSSYKFPVFRAGIRREQAKKTPPGGRGESSVVAR
jgi:hypothetical protein